MEQPLHDKCQGSRRPSCHWSLRTRTPAWSGPARVNR